MEDKGAEETNNLFLFIPNHQPPKHYEEVELILFAYLKMIEIRFAEVTYSVCACVASVSCSQFLEFSC